MPEDRPTITVLFADQVGFTSRADRLDPEDVRRMLDPCHGVLRSQIERMGGMVEKLIGDEVMAVFGLPAAHEDDAERAVRAALAIRDAMADTGVARDLAARVDVTTEDAARRLAIGPTRADRDVRAGPGPARGRA